MRWLAHLGGEAEATLALTRDGRMLAWALNEDGRSRLVFTDLASGTQQAAPDLLPGVVEGLAWAPDGSEVALGFNGVKHPQKTTLGLAA
jgi:protease II